MPNLFLDMNKLLLVEDDGPNLLVAGTYLELLGYPYDIARTGEEAIKKACSITYRAILMDIKMPDIDGLTATKHIRRYEQENSRPRTPIIGLTAYAFFGDRQRGIDAGMDDYISKPFTDTQLLSKLQKYMERV